MALVLAVSLASCDDISQRDAVDIIAQAREYREAGDLNASLIELKNALQAEPDNREARLLLGRVHLGLFDFEPAEKELLRARDLGVPPKDYVKLLGQTWLSMGKPAQVLEEIQPNAMADPVARATAFVVIGKAQLQLAEQETDEARLAEAETAFGQALSAAPSLPEALAGLGRIAMNRREFPETERLIDAALAIDSASIDAITLQGDLSMARGQPAEAAKAFAQAVEQDPLHLVWRTALAWAQINARRPEEAIPHIERLLKAAPSNQDVNYLRAFAALMLNDQETALRHAEISLKSGDHLPSLFVGGSAAYSLGRFELAFKYLQGFIISEPDASEARKLLAAASLKLGQVQTAIKSLEPLNDPSSLNDANLFAAVGEAAIRAGLGGPGKRLIHQARAAIPVSSESLTGFGLSSIQSGEPVQAIEDLERAVELDPRNAQAHSLLVLGYLAKHDMHKALAAAARFQQLLPDNADGYALAGITHRLMGNAFDARSALEHALELQPGEPMAAKNLAILALRAGNRDEARDLYDSVLELKPTHLETLINYARLEIDAKNYEAAIERLRTAEEADPKSADAFTQVGTEYDRMGNAVDARSAFERALELQPGEPEAVNKLAILALRAGNRDEARDLYDSALKREPTHLKTLTNYALLETDANNNEAAIERLRTALDAHPNSVKTRSLLGGLYIDTSDPAQGLSVVEPALAEFPEDPGLLLVAGKAQLQLGQPGLAIEHLLRHRTVRPNMAMSSIYLARAYVAVGDSDQAIEAFRAASEAEPKNFDVKYELARLEGKAGRLEAANALLEELTQAEPENPLLAELGGNIALAEGDPERGVGLFKKALESRKTNVLTIQLAKAQFAAGRKDEGFATLTDWLDTYPGDLTTRTLLAGTYLKDEQFGPAQFHYEKLLQANPESVSTLNSLAWVMHQLGDADGALVHAERARELQPNNAGVADTLGALLLDLNRDDDALPLLAEAHKNAPDDPAIATHYARALIRKERHDEALKLLRQALSVAQPFTNRDEAEALLNKLGE